MLDAAVPLLLLAAFMCWQSVHPFRTWSRFTSYPACSQCESSICCGTCPRKSRGRLVFDRHVSPPAFSSLPSSGPNRPSLILLPAFADHSLPLPALRALSWPFHNAPSASFFTSSSACPAFPLPRADLSSRSSICGLPRTRTRTRTPKKLQRKAEANHQQLWNNQATTHDVLEIDAGFGEQAATIC